MTKRRRKPLSDRLLAFRQIDPETGCWNFMGGRHVYGYGLIGAGGKGAPLLGAHRAAYELWVGPIPDGYHVHHKCDNPPCFNPEHLEAISPLEHRHKDTNGNKQKTHCRYGHPLDGKNLRIYVTKEGREERVCRRCKTDTAIRRYWKNPGEARARDRESKRRVRERKLKQAENPVDPMPSAE